MVDFKARQALKQRCPRRGEMGQRAGEGELPDRWARAKHRKGLGAGEMLCSYCGSLHPDIFIEYVRKGYVVGPTDKSYKAYLHEPVTPEMLEVARRRFDEGPMVKTIIRSMEAEDTPEHEIEAEVEKRWQEDLRMLAGRDVAKFYFQHLSVEQRHEFCELYNNGVMQVGFPGHFYTPPFFTK